MRDFKKESTAFVPNSLQRKRPAAGGGAGKVNAAPALDGENQAQGTSTRPDIVSTLMVQFGGAKEVKPQEKSKVKDDYEKFVEGMEDILGPAPPR